MEQWERDNYEEGDLLNDPIFEEENPPDDDD